MIWIDLAKLGASLIAIIGVAWLAGRMGLGGDLRIRDADHAKVLANEAIYGFEATEVALDRAGVGALLKDAQGNQMLLRRHGAAWVGRLLDPAMETRLDQGFLTISTGEPGAEKVTLNLGEAAQIWAAGMRRLVRA
ncbi:hypothetical protein [Sphingorhabdus sp.]|jgi:hypothetical protein|uniref:hypothetical protein n=2 Tax=Sphingorhabdus sp. TaxID=1902408 RepID=UPI003BAE56A8|nr:hypothetical protein [Sphingomonadales bacterium]MBK9431398.1 hypothetical protein [Sphingomonadales bacterium]MBL0022696.1 hypothetical protein [Sphingomonadales bacterium]